MSIPKWRTETLAKPRGDADPRGGEVGPPVHPRSWYRSRCPRGEDSAEACARVAAARPAEALRRKALRVFSQGWECTVTARPGPLAIALRWIWHDPTKWQRRHGCGSGRRVLEITGGPNVRALRDADGRMALTDGFVSYRSGAGRGKRLEVRFPGLADMDAAHALAAALARENIEERALAIRDVLSIHGEGVLGQAAAIIQQDERGALMSVRTPVDRLRYVRVADATSGRAYYLPVHPRTRTAAQGVAASFGLAAAAYNPVQES